MLHRVDVSEELTASDISEEFTASIISVMMEAVNSSETSVIIYQNIRCNIPEESHHNARRFENLKSCQIRET
jgi:hypothetical protein